jgi:hypothetical protein
MRRAARAAGAEDAIHADKDDSRPRDAASVHAALARHGYEPYDDEGVTDCATARSSGWRRPTGSWSAGPTSAIQTADLP